MPHFLVDVAEPVIENSVSSEQLMQLVWDSAESTGLFDPANIKVRLRRYQEWIGYPDRASFIHVFAYIMQGRTVEQRESLSRQVVGDLIERLPEVPVISMNVMEFEKDSYHNRQSIRDENSPR